MAASFENVDPSLSPSSSAAKAQGDKANNFIKNIFPEIFHFLQQNLPFPIIVNVVPDTFVQIFKLRFNYQAINETLTNQTSVTNVGALIEGIDVFQISDVRDVTSTMSCGKNPGSASFTLNQMLINNRLVESLDLIGSKFVPKKELLRNVDNSDVVIDFMDILKVYERNRFTDDYTSIFTGFITSVGHKDQPKVDFSYRYGAHDVTTALRLAPIVSQVSMAQLVTAGTGQVISQSNLIWDNPLVANKPAIDLLKDIIGGTWWTYPQTSQVEESNQVSDNSKFTRVQILNPSEIGLLKLNVFPSNLPNLKAYGAVFSKNLNLSFYQQRDKLPYDICKDIADVIGLEFYGTPEGNIYFGIPKWDIDIDGGYYGSVGDGIVFRKGFYSLDGEMVEDSENTQDFAEEADIYTINEEDVLDYEEQSSIENVITRVDVGITDWSQDVLRNKNISVLQSAFREQFFFSYPDIQFWNPETIASSTEALREFTRLGIRPFPVQSKVFLSSDESMKAYAQFCYDKLKGMRKQAKLTIIPRAELRAGRTIRIPYKNLIAYGLSVTNSVMPKKSASTQIQLGFIRSADIDIEKSRFSHIDPKSAIEEAYGSFIPSGTFDFTSLQE